jgi:hypothetical protein
MKRAIRLFPWRREAVQGEHLPKRYAKTPDGRAIIRLNLSSDAALLMPFESFPANFEKDLDNTSTPVVLNLNQDLVDYLFARLSERNDEPLLLRVTIPPNADEVIASPAILKAAIQRYFAYLASTRRQNLRQLARDAVLFVCLGTGSLGLSVLLETVPAHPESGFLVPLLNQGITVFGWLTFWEAFANALWNWRPLYRQLRMCQRLQEAMIEVEA